ncbi:MAG: DUF3576 domain-containing protein [Pseudomonadota bacterium]|jgi:hypothetical protein
MSVKRIAAAAAVLGLVLAGCAHKGDTAAAGKGDFSAPAKESGFSLLPSLGGHPPAQAPANIGVNAFLWRASLDTLAFMPLASADPFGGLIITDWYTNPEKPDERFKATVYILDTRLRADGINVNVYKQVKDASGGWVDAPVSNQTDTDVENAILTRARQLKLSTINTKG